MEDSIMPLLWVHLGRKGLVSRWELAHLLPLCSMADVVLLVETGVVVCDSICTQSLDISPCEWHLPP